MNKLGKEVLLVLLLSTLMTFILSTTVLANSAEPPSLVILVKNPPKDLSITLLSDGSESKIKFRRVAWEGYYSLYHRDMNKSNKYTFKITTKEKSFEYTVNSALQEYSNVFTLDLSTEKLTPGTYPFRREILVSIRLILTLLIEGCIFWLYGFRQKRSWIIFLCINLVTQGDLNIWLNNGGPIGPSYLFYDLIFAEFFVFVGEMIAFPTFINERKKSYSLSYAFVANLISLIAGGFIITLLPV